VVTKGAQSFWRLPDREEAGNTQRREFTAETRPSAWFFSGCVGWPGTPFDYGKCNPGVTPTKKPQLPTEANSLFIWW